MSCHLVEPCGPALLQRLPVPGNPKAEPVMIQCPGCSFIRRIFIWYAGTTTVQKKKKTFPIHPLKLKKREAQGSNAPPLSGCLLSSFYFLDLPGASNSKARYVTWILWIMDARLQQISIQRRSMNQVVVHVHVQFEPILHTSRAATCHNHQRVPANYHPRGGAPPQGWRPSWVSCFLGGEPGKWGKVRGRGRKVSTPCHERVVKECSRLQDLIHTAGF